jgi:3D (Asp-Asp-Asp) domain-containing protein
MEDQLAHKAFRAPSWSVVLGCLTLVLIAGCTRFRTPQSIPPPAPEAPPSVPEAVRIPFAATAYSLHGETASGTYVRRGIVAADPRVLPLGTKIRVHGAGAYSGEYEVADTGRRIKGREIDIYVPNVRAAKRFGRRRVEIEILRSSQRPGRAGLVRHRIHRTH